MSTPQTIELDGRALKAEAEKSHELSTLVHYGANRERNREVTDIEQMRKGLIEKHKEKLDPDKWIEAFKTLEDMGLGSLIIGRRGNPNRFRWNYSLKSIGTAAVNGLPLTAHRIVPKLKGGKYVNDYNSSRPTLVTRPVRDEDEVVEERQPARRPPGLVKREAAPVAAPSSARNMIFVSLRPDYTFEADIPDLTEREADVLCSAIRRCVK